MTAESTSPGGPDREDRSGRNLSDHGDPPSRGRSAAEGAAGGASSGGATTDTSPPEKARPQGLYFFPEDEVTAEELREILARGDRERRAWAISHLLRYAQWEDIWMYVDRDEVRDIFPELELGENLRTAWGRMLKIETPVG